MGNEWDEAEEQGRGILWVGRDYRYREGYHKDWKLGIWIGKTGHKRT